MKYENKNTTILNLTKQNYSKLNPENKLGDKQQKKNKIVDNTLQLKNFNTFHTFKTQEEISIAFAYITI